MTVRRQSVEGVDQQTDQLVETLKRLGGVELLAHRHPNGTLPLNGGTLTGPLTLAADPVSGLQAATKQYVDAGDAVSTTIVGFPASASIASNAFTAFSMGVPTTNPDVGAVATPISSTYGGGSPRAIQFKRPGLYIITGSLMINPASIVMMVYVYTSGTFTGGDPYGFTPTPNGAVQNFKIVRVNTADARLHMACYNYGAACSTWSAPGELAVWRLGR